MHSFLCSGAQFSVHNGAGKKGRRQVSRIRGRGQVSGGRDKRAEVRNQKVEDGGSESEKVRSLEEGFVKSRLRFLTTAILPQK